MLIEDEDSLAADLPRTYGVDDFTLVLLDKLFQGGRMVYEVTGAVFEDGFISDALVVNGADLNALAVNWGNMCGDGAMAINGQPMKMDRIDEEVQLGTTEIWRIRVDDQLHPFHIHGGSFRILSQNGAPPPAYADGWKDMVHVEEGWSEVLMGFDQAAPPEAPYMYHCHILEHEDCGMMGQFTVT